MGMKIITSIAIEKNNKFLILKRAQNETYGSMWEFPGGKVDANEKLVECAKREVIEESGLIPNKIIYKGYSERFTEEINGDSGHVIVHHFYCNDFKGKVKLSREHTDFKWITKEEILKMKMGGEIRSDTVEFFRLFID
ncbi:MAG: NUDIX domain-containing protein [Candidatus Aenigmatarchaeota archaeon]|nr:NUDIX domain-containing protein [Candidatus Aenigmarchaeota archaeon]